MYSGLRRRGQLGDGVTTRLEKRMVLSGERLERGGRREVQSKERAKMSSATAEDEDERLNEASRSRDFQERQHAHDQEEMQHDERRPVVDYAESIEKVKDCGWLVYFNI